MRRGPTGSRDPLHRGSKLVVTTVVCPHAFLDTFLYSVLFDPRVCGACDVLGVGSGWRLRTGLLDFVHLGEVRCVRYTTIWSLTRRVCHACEVPQLIYYALISRVDCCGLRAFVSDSSTGSDVRVSPNHEPSLQTSEEKRLFVDEATRKTARLKRCMAHSETHEEGRWLVFCDEQETRPSAGILAIAFLTALRRCQYWLPAWSSLALRLENSATKQEASKHLRIPMLSRNNCTCKVCLQCVLGVASFRILESASRRATHGGDMEDQEPLKSKQARATRAHSLHRWYVRA